jgi:hypothetical protein
VLLDIFLCAKGHGDNGKVTLADCGACPDKLCRDGARPNARRVVAPSPHHARILRAHQRRANPQPLDGLGVFYHIACMGDGWRAIVTEQLRLFRHAGLAAVTSAVLGTESDRDWCIAAAAALGVTLAVPVCEANFARFEGPTLQLAWKWAGGHPHAAVLYAHTKGVTTPTCPMKKAWRRLMGKHVVADWRRNMIVLQKADAVGIALFDSGYAPFFAGNFWMARCDWIKELPSPVAFDQAFSAQHPHLDSRIYAEMWLGVEPWFHPECLLARNECLWFPGGMDRHDVTVPALVYED